MEEVQGTICAAIMTGLLLLKGSYEANLRHKPIVACANHGSVWCAMIHETLHNVYDRFSTSNSWSAGASLELIFGVPIGHATPLPGPTGAHLFLL